MVIFNLKMAFGILSLLSSWANVMEGKPVANEQEKQSQPQVQTGDDNASLKKFIDLINKRSILSEDVAKYKWINGAAIYDEVREKAVLESAKKTTEEMGFQFKPEDELFFTDLMEASKFLQYVFFSNWNGAREDDNTPKETEVVDISVIRQKISGMQKELIELLYNLKKIQNDNDCQTTIAKAIANNRNEDNLYTLALQRAFGNYCKLNLSHKSKK